jgi:hypothetical protein
MSISSVSHDDHLQLPKEATGFVAREFGLLLEHFQVLLFFFSLVVVNLHLIISLIICLIDD